MDPTTERLYDEYAYASIPVYQSHPDYCAVIATLHGVSPPPVGDCRVLELGCNRGDNLLPMAETIPGGRFTGVDISGRAIREATETAQALGLDNVEFRQADVMEAAGGLGEYDYILVTGLHMAVPRAVQARIFEICRASLAPQGIGFVNHAVYPGSQAIVAIREVLRRHIRHIEDPRGRIAAARALSDFLARAQPTTDNPYGEYLKGMFESVVGHTDENLLHEYLAEVFTPTYFHEFADQLEKGGLQFLCDVEFDKSYPCGLGEEVLAELQQFGADRLEREQHLDFICTRSVRSSLFAHPGIEADAQVDAARLDGLLVSSPARPTTPGGDPLQSGKVRFTAGEKYIDVGVPVIKSVLLELTARWPRPAGLDELLTAASERLVRRGVRPPDADAAREVRRTVQGFLLKGFAHDLVQLHTRAPQVADTASGRPVAGALARLQAARGERPTTLYHRPAPLDEPYRRVLERLDGSRDRESLLDLVAAMDDEGLLGPPVDKGAGAAARRAELERKLGIILDRLVAQPLLAG